jgi:DNA-binding CsgD family transcriptional regulator
VTALAAGDAERLLRFVADAETTDDDPPFTGDFLAELLELVGGECAGYGETDFVRRRSLACVESSGGEYDVPYPDPLYWSDVADVHPIRLAHARGYAGALKISDFLTRKQLRASGLHDWFRLYGVEHSIELQLPSPPWHTKSFFVDRHAGRDFTERDRLVLDFLRPHLKRRWDEAQTLRRLHAALDELERAGADGSQGVILVSRLGRVEFISKPARRLLRAYFGQTRGRRLAPAVTDWLQSGSSEPLERVGTSRRLIVERDGSTLLLSERQVRPVLTRREQEVLSWVSRGKTNAEVALVLSVSPGTVRKHLENVYAKLGVKTRTAAVARFLGLLEAEAS